MEVEYELTQDDLFAYQWRAAFATPRGRRGRRAVYGIWLLVVVLFAIVPAIGADGISLSRVSLTFIVVTFGIVALFQWVLERRLMRRAIRQLLKEERPERGQLGRHRVVLGDEGVRENTAVGESRTSWRGVDRVEEDQQYIYIYTTPFAAFVIPRRAFGDARDAERFYQLARSRKAAAG